MSTVYALFPGSIPAFSRLEQVAQVTGSKIILVDRLEALKQYKHEKGVLLLGGETERLNGLTGVIRTMAPQLSCILVLEPSQLQIIDQDALQLADVLMVPFENREAYARINGGLHISDLRRLIADSAQLDEGTGLFNYQYFIKRLSEEISLSKRHLSPLCCVVISISYYEVFMDSYGYQFVLGMMQQFAKACNSTVRKEDIVARLGDSEIGILLPHSTEKGTLSMVQRLVQRIEKMPIFMGDQEEHLTLKAGIAGFPIANEPDIDADTLVRYARHSLHIARCSDKSNVELFGNLSPKRV